MGKVLTTRKRAILIFLQYMSKTKFLLPVEPLFAVGIIGVVFLGMQLGVSAYQRFENYQKVNNVNVAKKVGC